LPTLKTRWEKSDRYAKQFHCGNSQKAVSSLAVAPLVLSSIFLITAGNKSHDREFLPAVVPVEDEDSFKELEQMIRSWDGNLHQKAKDW